MKELDGIKIDMWYGDAFAPGRFFADASFSDCDCIYRGNIYNDAGQIIGDFDTADSVLIKTLFRIEWCS